MISTVAIVGRPNVGKSTLFNRLVGRRQAIVHDLPGVTRDRITAEVEVGEDRSFLLIDTGGLVLNEDSLGLSKQVFLAIDESDALLMVVDGREGLLPADQEIWERLRRTGKPIVLVVNKGDTKAAQSAFDEFFLLGAKHQVLASSEHGFGMPDLLEALLSELPEPEVRSTDDSPAIAIVGRPNVGKSSILNRLVGGTRSLVAAEAGTTRDPVDSHVEWEGKRYRLIDTAGIRRRSQVSGIPEEIAVMMARRQLDQADLALLVIEASSGVTSGDLSIAGAIIEAGRPAIVVINKWDLLDTEGREDLEKSWERLEEILSQPFRVNISALTGRGFDRLFPWVERAIEGSRVRVGTSELNRILELAVRGHHAPARRGRPWKFYYATQVGQKPPPTFMLFANATLPRQSSYRRYLANRLREALDLRGIPVRLVVRQRKARE